MSNVSNGILYVVATPIGNLTDLSARALSTLQHVDIIAAEDTRHTLHLLKHYDIEKKLLSLHAHNESTRSQHLLRYLLEGNNIALVSDAGTPAICDPGYRLIQTVREANIRVIPIPGACALTTALSASGLRADQFIFSGFLPIKTAQRQKIFSRFTFEPWTVIFYEAPHRLLDCLSDMKTVWGDARHIVLARELTKHYEHIYSGPISTVHELLMTHTDQQRGECVLLVQGHESSSDDYDEARAQQILSVLLAELPLKQSVKLAEKILDYPHRYLYQLALTIR